MPPADGGRALALVDKTTGDDLITLGGASIRVPAGVTRLKILSPGRNTLALEWTSGPAIIVPKAFSAEVNFVVPGPPSTEPPGEFSLRYTVESGK